VVKLAQHDVSEQLSYATPDGGLVGFPNAEHQRDAARARPLGPQDLDTVNDGPLRPQGEQLVRRHLPIAGAA
jgi:hypothetical protein